MTKEQLRYPTGKFKTPESVSASDISKWVGIIEKFPERIKKEVASLNDSQLDTPYREEGWTVRQVVHHVADSHMNAYIRFKLALTENIPIIKPYLEALWAELPDSKASISISIPILENVHKRWVLILCNMSPTDFERKFFHPEQHNELILKMYLPCTHGILIIIYHILRS